MADTKFEVVRSFRWTDPRSGDDIDYSPDDNNLWDGPDPTTGKYAYLTSESGPDGLGPVLKAKDTKKPADKPADRPDNPAKK